MPRKKKESISDNLYHVEETPREKTLKVNDESLLAVINKKTRELPDMISNFAEKNVKINYDKFGNEKNVTNPYLVSTYFFKSINPTLEVEPIYTSEQLTKIYELYSAIMEQINLQIMPLQPTLSHFAKFAGMSLNNLANLKYSEDQSMKVLVEKIYNDTFDANLTLSQHHRLEKSTTTFRMKVENEAVEKKIPNISVKVSTKPIDIEKIESRVRQLKNNAANKTLLEDDYE